MWQKLSMTVMIPLARKSSISQDTCVMCGRTFKESRIMEEINGSTYFFDRKECAIMLKKFKSVYGNDFLIAAEE